MLSSRSTVQSLGTIGRDDDVRDSVRSKLTVSCVFFAIVPKQAHEPQFCSRIAAAGILLHRVG